MELTSETTVRDPGAHAKLQFMELDKTAKRSMAKKKAAIEQLSADQKALKELEEQIASLKSKYDPLCEHLADARAQKAKLMKTLEQCITEERRIMGDTKGVIQVRRQEESKMTKKMGSLELELLRGYTLNPESTFYQSKKSSDDNNSPSGSPARPMHATTGHDITGGASGQGTKRGRSNLNPLGNKATTLPPLK